MGFADPTRAPRRTSCDGFSAPTRNRVQQREANVRAARDRAAEELAEREREQRRRGYKGPRVAPKKQAAKLSAVAAEAAEYRAWAERAPEAASADAAAPKKPALSEGKMRDYGYGVPAWSPYYIHPKLKDYFGKRVPTTSASTYGDYVHHVHAGSATDPIEQCRAARTNIIEQNGRATTDHVWEMFGHRPSALEGDLEWTKIVQKDRERRAASARRRADEDRARRAASAQSARA